MTYTIVVETSTHALSERINLYIEEGWQCLGGPLAVVHDCGKPNEYKWCQAIIHE